MPGRRRWLLFGPPRDPMDMQTRRKLALAVFLAWIGLGADGLSSANYGPAEAYLALGNYTGLGLYVALASAITVFVIALGYNQVIALFPNGGGGYKVATQLLGSYAGLVAGSALVIDYVLTVAISIAAGVDALFSMFPVSMLGARLDVEIAVLVVLMWLNLRGIKESVAVLAPIFVGFLLTHGFLVIFGIATHTRGLPSLLPETFAEAHKLATQSGWIFVVAVLLRAYSLGAGTYTGIEAVSNNIHVLAEPRVRTGHRTMMAMASTLAFMACGLMVLYLLLQVKAQEGQTLNAIAFRMLVGDWTLVGFPIGPGLLAITLAFAAGILFVAGNTGFLGGPAVLANMAVDRWLPHQFSSLSSRLVTHVGISLMGLGAIAILIATQGEVDVLVVLYSINVFITFALCLLGLCVYWLRNREPGWRWWRQIALSAVGFGFSAAILVILFYEKLFEGGWATILGTTAVIVFCLLVRRHYAYVERQLRAADRRLDFKPKEAPPEPVKPDPSKPTAVFLIGSSYGSGMHTLLNVARTFPNHFRNFVFVSVGEVDSSSFGGSAALDELKAGVCERLASFEMFCRHRGIAAVSYSRFGTDVVDELTTLCRQVAHDFPNCVFFAPRLVLANENWFVRQLHNHTALEIQRRLHGEGLQMMVLPMRIN